MEGLYSGVGVFVYCENGIPGAALDVFVVKGEIVDYFVVSKFLSPNGYDMAVFGFRLGDDV